MASSVGNGIRLGTGGVMVNGSSGRVISASSNGIEIDIGTGTVTNFGNISGEIEVRLGNGGTVGNFGTMTGGQYAFYAGGSAGALETNFTSGTMAGSIALKNAAARRSSRRGEQ